MKQLLRILQLLIIITFFSIALNSCDKELCYECIGFDNGTTSLEDLGTICEGDDNGVGGTYSEDELEEAVDLYEAFGGSCTKK